MLGIWHRNRSRSVVCASQSTLHNITNFGHKGVQGVGHTLFAGLVFNFSKILSDCCLEASAAIVTILAAIQLCASGPGVESATGCEGRDIKGSERGCRLRVQK